MTRARLALATLVLLAGAVAQAKPTRRHAASHKHRHARTQERAVAPAPPGSRDVAGASEAGGAPAFDDAKPATAAQAGGKTLRTKTYTFGAMDVEGKLKTPQLLYFLNRVKLELDMSAPDKRSFMKELNQSADDRSL